MEWSWRVPLLVPPYPHILFHFSKANHPGCDVFRIWRPIIGENFRGVSMTGTLEQHAIPAFSYQEDL